MAEMTKQHLWYIEALIETPVTISVVAADEQDAFGRLIDGTWHGCEQRPRDWSQSKVKGVGTFTEGPGINR